jgi:hypothetical protein
MLGIAAKQQWHCFLRSFFKAEGRLVLPSIGKSCIRKSPGPTPCLIFSSPNNAHTR